MHVVRLPVRDDRVDLLAVDLARHPATWPAYQRGLQEAYAEIGAGDLAMGSELPADVTAVVVAVTPNRAVVGGVLLRRRSGIGQFTGRTDIADAIAQRVPEGVNEIGGCWIRPAWRGGGRSTALVREILRVAAGGGRWTVTLANQFSIGASIRAGLVPDQRFRDLTFPDSRFRSTLCWFDHHGEGQ